MAQLANGNEVVTPTEAEATLAKESGRKLAAHLGDAGGLRLEVKAGKASEELVLPPSALRLLVRALTELGEGNAVTLTPLRAELTTQQAADLLNVSRPHLVKLLYGSEMKSALLPGIAPSSHVAPALRGRRFHLRSVLDEGTIPSRRVGSHRRVRLTDLLAYKREFLTRRQAALEELAGLSQDLKMGY
jgi:hypothetical protein